VVAQAGKWSLKAVQRKIMVSYDLFPYWFVFAKLKEKKDEIPV
jgi:hypothetical protein